MKHVLARLGVCAIHFVVWISRSRAGIFYLQKTRPDYRATRMEPANPGLSG